MCRQKLTNVNQSNQMRDFYFSTNPEFLTPYHDQGILIITNIMDLRAEKKYIYIF